MSNAAFTDLEDSPIFRARASELEQGLDRVKDRAQKLIKDAAKYCKSIEGQHAATLSFADSLETFCGGTDEESMLTGPGAAAPMRRHRCRALCTRRPASNWAQHISPYVLRRRPDARQIRADSAGAGVLP